MELIYQLDEIDNTARAFLTNFEAGQVFAFNGQMGAGKTTFIITLCRMLGVEGAVSSPTFSIINEYSIQGGKIYHLDLYRLRSSEEAVQAGVEDVLFSGSTCFVEWPEKAPELFPENTVMVELKLVNADTRKISWQRGNPSPGTI